MKIGPPITESIISSRNILLGGRSDENVVGCLTNVLDSLDSISIASIRRVVGYCVLEAVHEIQRSNYVGAGFILNLIHNLPLDDASEQNWDIDYFLSMELPTFLEHFDEIGSSRKIVLCVCGEIVAHYSDQ